MHNYHAIETEVAHRRREWQRAVAADTRAAQTHSQTGRRHCLPRSVQRWRSLAAARLLFLVRPVPRRGGMSPAHP